VLAIPLSLLVAVSVFKLLGVTINTMSLGGMTIAIGSLVDDAIIDVENVFKRLRENHKRPKKEKLSAFKVVFEASKEIRASILNATIIIIVAFLPLFFLSGMEGRMLKPLGIAYIVSLFASLLVALTVTPQLCKMLLSSEKYLLKKEKQGWFTRNLFTTYGKALNWSLNFKKSILLITGALLVVSFFALSVMGRSFLPEFNEGALTISAISKPGISLEESNKLGNLMEKELLKISEVVSTARRTGRGELDEHSQTTNSAEIDVNYVLDERDNEIFLEDVRQTLASIPGIAATVGQPLGHRIDHMLSGTRANIAIKLFGTDLNKLFALGNQIKSSVNGIEGLVDVNVEQQVEIPQIQIRANRDMLAAYGITIQQFTDYVDIAFAGEKFADIYEGQKSFDLIVRLNKDYTENKEGLENALIEAGDGKKVPLRQVAEIVSVSGPSSISRENVQRKVVVSANVAGGDLLGVVTQIKQKVNENIVFPEGYRIEFGGQFESEARASKTLLLTSLISILLIFLILFQEFRDVKLSGIILLNLPLALIGGVFTIYFTTKIISIPVIIGFITLFGIATRNGILLVSHYKQLQNEGVSLKDTIIKGSIDRLNPILMTALTAALALIPLAMNGDATGNEIQSPMAKVILGGLLSSTLLNIFIVPIVYSIIQKRRGHE
jgi:CzcA family heavy metal efflux pump